MPGPLHGVKVVEFAAIGPAPFAGMMLADMGATVLRIERSGPKAIDGGHVDFLARGRPAVVLDLKSAQGRAACLTALSHADALIEGFRPGVMERLDLGPDQVLAANPRLVYGRITGWGRDGPLAHAAGHDINYIALAGALGAIGSQDGGPVPPLNLIGDFGGGGMLLAFGVVCALLEARISGRGQVVDAAMLDGAALLMASVLGLHASGLWQGERGGNLLDGGAPFYRCYRCADGLWIAIGAIETKFYAELHERLALADAELAPERQWDRERWPAQTEKLRQVFASRDRAHWCRLLEGADACFAPVLGFDELADHPHNAARGTFIRRHGQIEPAPGPRYSRTQPSVREPDREEVLRGYGIADPI